MKKTPFYNLLVGIFISSVFFSSCMTDVDLTNLSSKVFLDESLVIPIGSSSISMEELLKTIGDQKVIGTAGNEIYFQKLDSTFFKFRDINLSQNSKALDISLPLSTKNQVIPAGIIIPTATDIPETINLGLNTDPANEKIDSVKVATASFDIEVTINNVVGLNPNNLKFSLIFQGGKVRKLDGTSSTITLSPNVLGKANGTINGFMLNTSGLSGIPILLRMDPINSATPVTLSPTSEIKIKLKLNTLNYDVAYGFFQPSNVSSDSVRIPIDLSYIPDAVLKFNNPRAVIDLESTIGTYLGFKIDYVKAFNTIDSTQVIKASFNGNESKTYSLTKPKSIGKTVNQVIILDKDNGATDKLFSSIIPPNVLKYKFSSKVDLDSIAKDPTTNFITPDAYIKAMIKIQIPFYLNAGSSYKPTSIINNVKQNIDSVLKGITVDSAILVLKFTNSFPIKVNCRMTLCKSNALNDTIANPSIQTYYNLKAPVVDASTGLVKSDGVSSETLQVKLNKYRIDELKQTKFIRCSLIIDGENTDDGKSTKPIQITKQSKFEVKLGVFVKGNPTQLFVNN